MIGDELCCDDGDEDEPGWLFPAVVAGVIASAVIAVGFLAVAGWVAVRVFQHLT